MLASLWRDIATGKVLPLTTNLWVTDAASSVKQYLVDLGADINRIDVLSMGDEFATPNADSTTSALERKAHFVVLGGS